VEIQEPKREKKEKSFKSPLKSIPSQECDSIQVTLSEASLKSLEETLSETSLKTLEENQPKEPFTPSTSLLGVPTNTRRKSSSSSTSSRTSESFE